jgi:ElaB/YqjD/DUF883 family membrane-anchored ribosome-binding protein
MTKPDPHRAELHALAAELAQPGAGRALPADDDHAKPSGEGSADLEKLIGELQGKLSDAANDAEEIITAHPLAAVASALLLGIVIGRLMGRRS